MSWGILYGRYTHARIQNVFARGGATHDSVVFLVNEGKEHPNTTKMAFRWRADGCPTLNASLVALWFQGMQTSIAEKPYNFVIFSGVGGGGPDPLSPSGSTHVYWYTDQSFRAQKIFVLIAFVPIHSSNVHTQQLTGHRCHKVVLNIESTRWVYFLTGKALRMLVDIARLAYGYW